jgi:hypothetical protein
LQQFPGEPLVVTEVRPHEAFPQPPVIGTKKCDHVAADRRKEFFRE